MRLLKLGCIGLVGLALVGGLLIFTLLVYEGKRRPSGDPTYVAMGSSFAAGIGLGVRAPDSPIACMRTLNGYPRQLARLLGLPLLDVTCSGATTDHVLRGGQFFQRAQLEALTSATRLVTITTGGNDIRYVGDLSFIAARNATSLSGWLMRRFWGGPAHAGQRDYEKVRRDLIAFVGEVHRRAPAARVIIVTYPMILPFSGICPKLNISAQEADDMRAVGERLAAATRKAALESGALLVDIQRLGADHHACSAEPWVNGWIDAQGTQFHPTEKGARAMAEAVAQMLRGAHAGIVTNGNGPQA